MENNEEFRTVLKRERGRLGWTQKMLSERTKIPHGSIRNWECGRYVPADYIQFLLIDYMRKQGDNDG